MSLEAMSEHPLAEAVVNRIKSMQDVKTLKITDFKAVPGLGVTGNVIFPDGRMLKEARSSGSPKTALRQRHCPFQTR